MRGRLRPHRSASRVCLNREGASTMADESELTRANSALHQSATVNVLREFCLILARSAGLTEVSGLSLEDWLARQIASEHRRLLTAGGGDNPARTALQS